MNIFGKDVNQYQHLSKLKDKGLLDAHLKAATQSGKTFLFDSLKADNKFHDAEPSQGFGYLTNNLQAIQSEVEEVLYLNYRLNTLVPINNSIPEGAESYAFRVKNSYGEAGFIDSYGTNAGSASTSYSLRSTPILQGGIDAQWSLQDVRTAMFAGVPLQTDTIDDATTACLNHIEKVGLLGDVTKGFTGLITNADVPKIQEVTANTLETATDPARYINGHLNTIIDSTSTIFGNRITTGLTIYLPVKQFNFLATEKYATDASKTVMDYIKINNAWTANTGNPITFKVVIELKDAGLLSDDTTAADRMLIGFNNMRIMEMGNPIMPRVIGIENKLRYFKAPLEYSISQLNFKHPNGCLYVDGI